MANVIEADAIGSREIIVFSGPNFIRQISLTIARIDLPESGKHFGAGREGLMVSEVSVGRDEGGGGGSGEFMAASDGRRRVRAAEAGICAATSSVETGV